MRRQGRSAVKDGEAQGLSRWKLRCETRLTYKREVLVDKGDGHAAFPNAAGDALDGAVAHIAGTENTGKIGFESEGFATGRPR